MKERALASTTIEPAQQDTITIVEDSHTPMADTARKCRPRICSTCSLEVVDVCTPWIFFPFLLGLSFILAVASNSPPLHFLFVSCMFSLPISTVWWSPRTSVSTGTASAPTAAAVLSPTAAKTAAGRQRCRGFGQQPGQSDPTLAVDPAAAHLGDFRTLWLGLFFIFLIVQPGHNRLFTPPRKLVHLCTPHDLPPCAVLRQ